MNTIRFAIIGCGGITLQNHLPGIALCPGAQLVALCHSEPARQQTGVAIIFTRQE